MQNEKFSFEISIEIEIEIERYFISPKNVEKKMKSLISSEKEIKKQFENVERRLSEIESNYKKEISELISICQSNQKKFHVITVFDDPYNIAAYSGMIFPVEIDDVESGFICASTNYTGYKDYFSFKNDIKKKNNNLKFQFSFF